MDRRRGLRIIRVDAFDLINDMVSNPERFGFTNVTDQAILVESGNGPGGYLFWDSVHPTTVAHEYVAQEALGALEGEFRAVRRLAWCRAADFRDRVERAAVLSSRLSKARDRRSRR